MLNLAPLRAVAERWREDAGRFRALGHEPAARHAEAYAAELEQALSEWEGEELTLDEAAAEAGLTPDAIGRRITRGDLPNAGRLHRPRVRRGDLFGPDPRPAQRLEGGEPDIATEMILDRT